MANSKEWNGCFRAVFSDFFPARSQVQSGTDFLAFFRCGNMASPLDTVKNIQTSVSLCLCRSKYKPTKDSN